MSDLKSETAKVATQAAPAAVLVLLDKDVIKRAQDGIRRSLLKLDVEVHDNAVQCLMHAEKHGDTSLMTRLLVDVLANSGYRAQGLTNWMFKHSPMVLKAKVITLQGTFEDIAQLTAAKKNFPDLDHTGWGVGSKRPFLVEQANKTPFWADAANRETVGRPIYQSTLLAPVDKMAKDMQAAIENTKDGQPIDTSKAFYSGIHSDKVLDFVKKVAEMRAQLPADQTREIQIARKRMADDAAFIEAQTKTA